MTPEAAKVESTVTIPADVHAKLLEDSRILDIYDMPGMIFPEAGEVRRRGRIMARSSKPPEAYIAFKAFRGGGPRPAPRPPVLDAPRPSPTSADGPTGANGRARSRFRA